MARSSCARFSLAAAAMAALPRASTMRDSFDADSVLGVSGGENQRRADSVLGVSEGQNQSRAEKCCCIAKAPTEESCRAVPQNDLQLVTMAGSGAAVAVFQCPEGYNEASKLGLVGYKCQGEAKVGGLGGHQGSRVKPGSLVLTAKSFSATFPNGGGSETIPRGKYGLVNKVDPKSGIAEISFSYSLGDLIVSKEDAFNHLGIVIEGRDDEVVMVRSSTDDKWRLGRMIAIGEGEHVGSVFVAFMDDDLTLRGKGKYVPCLGSKDIMKTVGEYMADGNPDPLADASREPRKPSNRHSVTLEILESLKAVTMDKGGRVHWSKHQQ